LITFPSISPGEATWGLVNNTQSFVSPLTGATQVVRLPGERWKFSFTYNVMTDEESAQMTAFIAQARGGAETFRVSNPLRKTQKGAATGTPLVKGGSQVGSSLDTDGWTPSTLVLKVGDYFEVNNELKIVTEDITSDGSGNATLYFEPPLRYSPADNAAITTTNPKATFRLDEKETSWRYVPGGFSSLVVTAIEMWDLTGAILQETENNLLLES
jgi:hypothetical protein